MGERKKFCEAFVTEMVRIAGERTRAYAEHTALEYWRMKDWRFLGPEELARTDVGYW